MTDFVVSLKNISKSYKKSECILEGLNLEIFPGEFIVVIGPSGSGKSTLLQIMGLLDRPTSGEYWFLGENVSRWSDRRLARARSQSIGIVFQSYNLVPTLTASENVQLPLVYQGVKARERVAKAHDLLLRVGMGHRESYRPAQLSGGQQQRVAIARALISNPPIILADEPTGNLDGESTQDVLKILKELHGKGHTIVLITHDRSLMPLANRVVNLDAGALHPVVLDTARRHADA